MQKIKYFLNWLFRNQTERRGKWVVAEVPNKSLLVFMVAIILNVALYPGFMQKAFGYIAYGALIYWGVQEFRSGRSRFRKLLGILGVIGAIGAFILTITAHRS